MDNWYRGIACLRGIAAFFIVGCHLGLSPRTAPGESVTWFCDMNVGLFAAISGFLLAYTFEREEDLTLRGYLKRRIVRLLPLYAFWTGFYLCASLVFSLVLKGQCPSGKYTNPHVWIDVVFWGGASCHLWFIASLFYAQMFYALVLMICRRMPGIYLPFAVLSIAIVFCSTLGQEFVLAYPCRLFGFVALGIAIYGFFKRKKLALKIALPLLIFGVAFHCFSAQWVHGFLRDWVLVAAIMLVFARKEMPACGGEVSAILSRCSLGVFLIHPFFAAGLAAFVARYITSPYGIGVVLVDWLCVYALALTTTFLLLRMPRLEKLIK